MKKVIVIDACRRLEKLLNCFSNMSTILDELQKKGDNVKELLFSETKIRASHVDRFGFFTEMIETYESYARHCGFDSPMYIEIKATIDALNRLKLFDYKVGPSLILPKDAPEEDQSLLRSIYQDIMLAFYSNSLTEKAGQGTSEK